MDGSLEEELIEEKPATRASDRKTFYGGLDGFMWFRLQPSLHSCAGHRLTTYRYNYDAFHP